jgi:predicted  nucleic acid-binding Zn-ribbon protein
MSSQALTIPEVLRRLHSLHQQMDQLRGRLMKGPRLAQAHQEQIRQAELNLEQAKKAHNDTRLASHHKQLEYEQKLADIQRRKGRLLECDDNREYQMLKDQIAADEMAASVLADEAIELMTRVEDMAIEVQKAEAALAAAKDAAAKWQAEFEKQEPTIRQEIARVEQELKHLETLLTGDVKELYQRALRNKGSSALAPLKGDFCGGCNQHVPLQMRSQLLLGNPIWCRSCGRLLYLPEDEAPHQRS